MNMNMLVLQFAEAVVKSYEAIMAGDHKKASKHSNDFIQYWKNINQLGDEGRKSLMQLFEHEHPGVRGNAAFFLLEYKTQDALNVLKELAKGQGLVAFEATEAIKRWEEKHTIPNE